MEHKDLNRVKVMAMVKEKQCSLKQAATKLNVSYRQIKRINARYQQEGDAGMIHRSRGKASNNRKATELRERVIEVYRCNYPDFGPTLACEQLQQDHGITVNHETVRRWLIDAGLWERKRRHRRHRTRRERKAQYGELVQFDGSPHDWFEGRRGRCCLMNMVDDATGRSCCFLVEEETTAAGMSLLRRWIEQYGIPQAVYCDRNNAYVTNRELTEAELRRGVSPRSHFEQACDRLGIEVIVAHSPQAKGRVERNHGVHQDRLVKGLRLAGISTIEQANEFIETTYLPRINNKFAKPARDPHDGHVPMVDATKLADIFCFDQTRTVSNDFVIRYENRLFQIERTARVRPSPGTKLIVRRWLDGSIHILWKTSRLDFTEISIAEHEEVRPRLAV